MPDPEIQAEEVVVAPAETPTEETVETPEGFIALDKHQKDVNVQHKKFRDEERGRVKEQQRADELQRELDTMKTEQEAVEVPPIPDQYSETYAADIAARDEAITRKSAQDAEITRREDEQKRAEEARVTKESEAITEKVKSFDSNMVQHGLNPAETKTAVDTIIGYGISNQFQDVLLEDKDGPLMVQYLAQNPLELEQMNAMSTLQLVNHLNGDIRQKAILLKPETSNAPPPPVTLSGGGAPETAESWERGAQYE